MSAPTGASATQLAARGGRVLQLTTSYRSVPAIQRFVNAAFAAEMTGERRTLPGRLHAARADRARPTRSQPAIVALPVPKPYGRGSGRCKASAKAIEESLPDAVGAFIAWLVDEAAAGRSPNGRPTAPSARAASAAAHRRAVPPLRQLRRGRDARATSTRSKRAAFRICSSAARRSTAARRSKRSAPRSPRSSGPTTSCRCSRR